MSKQAVDPVEEPEIDDAEESDEYDIEDEEGESGAVEEEEEEGEDEGEGAKGSSLTALLLGGEVRTCIVVRSHRSDDTFDREARKLLRRMRTKTRMMNTRRELISKGLQPLPLALSVAGKRTAGLPLARARSQETTESSKRLRKASRRGPGRLRMRMQSELLKRTKKRRKCNANFDPVDFCL
ncbi:hypothetical protein OH77DRAFT_811579 [Trametes cingulata]|nr:hypothetical protein OH77DRAFT_811579 [Trametes cingulata]